MKEKADSLLPSGKMTEGQGEELQSGTIALMRIPLVVAVIFIHSIGMPEYVQPYWNSFTGMDMFNWLRVCFSLVLPTVAVPAFFLISGYLFFRKTVNWDGRTYVAKMKRRLRTLVLPYILWNVLAFVLFSGPAFRGWLAGRGFDFVEVWNAQGGWHMFWDAHVFSDNLRDWSGRSIVTSGPLLAPLWFLRDLICVSLCSPLIYVLVRYLRLWGVGVLGFCYVSGLFPAVTGLSAGAVFFFSWGAWYALSQKNVVLGMRRMEKPALISGLALFVPAVLLFGRTTPAGQLVMPLFDIAGVIVVFCLFSRLWTRGCRRGISFSGASFFVYAAHGILVVPVVMKGLGKLLPWESPFIYGVRYLVVPFVVLAVCLCLYAALRRICPFCLSLLTGNR